MTDYWRSIKFGYSLVPDAADPLAMLRAAENLDALGYDLLGIQDHPYQPAHLDAWTLLSAIVARTERISVFPNVANLPLRPPAVLAKAAASLDLLSGGRVELGLGAGAFQDPIQAMGGDRRSPAEAVDALREAVEITRLMWSEQRSISYPGQYYSVQGLHPGPAPAHQIGIWLGAYKPRMLRLTGELSDGWLPSLGYIDADGIRSASASIDAAARGAGRDPAAIRRILNVGVAVTPEDLPRVLTRFAVEDGIDTFIFGGPPTETALRQLATDVIPRIRDAVQLARYEATLAEPDISRLMSIQRRPPV